MKTKASTGIPTYQLEGLLDWESSWFTKPPMWQSGYEGMRVDEIYSRVQLDLMELAARAYGNLKDGWKGPEHWGPWREHCARSLSKRDAELIPSKLLERLRSKNSGMARKANAELLQILNSRWEAERKEAITTLAELVINASDQIRSLFSRCPELVQSEAKHFEVWPVTLGLTDTAQGKRKPKFTGVDHARDYVLNLGLNGATPGKPPQGWATFPALAGALYNALLRIRRAPGVFFSECEKSGGAKRHQQSEWRDQLFSLPPQMTPNNSDQWWRVAKVLIDQLWVERQEMFRYLAERRKCDLQVHTPSLSKSRIIDDSLKKAFKGLSES